MIERAVKCFLEAGVLGFDFERAQGLVPFLARGSGHGIEIPAGNFRVQVFTGAFHADRGQAYADEDLFTGLRLEIEMALRFFSRGLPASNIPVRLRNGGRGERLRELHDEVINLVAAPTRAAAITARGAIVLDGELRVRDRGSDTMLQVHDDVGVAGRRKCVTMKTGASRGGEFHLDLIIRQQNRVVSGAGDFILMRKSRAITFAGPFTRREFQWANGRYHQKIS